MKSQSYKSQHAARRLIVFVAVSLMLGACTGTPVASPAPASIAQGEPPSITLKPPGPSIDVAPGETTSLLANPQGIEPQVTWTATCLKDSACQVLKNSTGADNFFTAPSTPGEIVTVRATVRDKYGREASAPLTFRVQVTPIEATKTATVTPISTPSPDHAPTASPAACNQPSCIAIGSLDWIPEGDGKSKIDISQVSGQIDNAIQISYTLQPAGWVGILKKTDLLRLTGTEKLVFFYKITGAPNTIELKLFYGAGAGTVPDREPIFLAKLPAKADTNGWTHVEVPYTDIKCEWADTGCTLGEKVDPGKVQKIGFAISFALGGASGPGSITIDGIQAIPASTSTSLEPTATLVPTKSTSPTGIAPVIASPKEGDEVNMNITVGGSVAEASMTAGTNLYVLVQPHGYTYWVQQLPVINSDGTWKASPVYVGQPNDSGLLFDICAVLTSQKLSRGQELQGLPDGTSSCITVKRKAELGGGGSAVTTPIAGAPVIGSPQKQDKVSMQITVSGSGAQAALKGGTNLYVIVQPHGYTYWVQALPSINSDGTWKASPVYVGQPNDSGLLFDICAVLTSQTLTRGQELPVLPSGPASCITVTRQ